MIHIHCDRCKADIDPEGKIGKKKAYAKDTRSLQNDVVILPERPKPKYTLEQINAMAAERGISYGQMVALLDQKEGRYGKKSQ